VIIKCTDILRVDTFTVERPTREHLQRSKVVFAPVRLVGLSNRCSCSRSTTTYHVIVCIEHSISREISGVGGSEYTSQRFSIVDQDWRRPHLPQFQHPRSIDLCARRCPVRTISYKPAFRRKKTVTHCPSMTGKVIILPMADCER
jgi:hypothetical protein